MPEPKPCRRCGSTERTKPYAGHPRGDCLPCKRAAFARYRVTEKGRARIRAAQDRYLDTERGRMLAKIGHTLRNGRHAERIVDERLGAS